MQLTNQLILNTVSELVGTEVLEVLNLVREQGEVSELELAEQIDDSINNTRTKLYKLHGHDILRYERKKDPEKGWYVGHWNFNRDRIEVLITKKREQKLEKLKQRLDRESQESFYLCPNLCVRLDFHDATDMQFRCPECGNLLNVQDNQRTINYIEQEIEKLTL